MSEQPVRRTGRLSWVTALTVAGLLLGGTATSAVAQEASHPQANQCGAAGSNSSRVVDAEGESQENQCGAQAASQENQRDDGQVGS
jgi:uncharacterized low-complexity protein